MSNNNMRNNMGNGRNMSGRRSISFRFDFCEPVAVNAAVFTALIVLDLFNKTNNLIPVHAIAGIVITLATLALCRYQYIAAAWAFAAIPAIFLTISFLYSASQNSYVISAEQGVRGAFDKLSSGARYVYDKADYLADRAVDEVQNINNYGQRTFSNVSNSVKTTSAAIADTWNRTFNQEIAKGATPAAAAVTATGATGTVPPAGTTAAATASAALPAGAVTTVSGEYLYLCVPGSVHDATAKACEACVKQYGPKDYAGLDKCIGASAGANAVCLGSLGSTGTPPSKDKRDACLACTNDTKTLLEVNACRCLAMGGKEEVCLAGTVAAATPGTVAPSAAAAPVAATASGFTNYGGFSLW